MIYNVDQYYKYIAPAISGFVNTNGVSGSKTETYFYCAQGTRDLMESGGKSPFGNAELKGYVLWHKQTKNKNIFNKKRTGR